MSSDFFANVGVRSTRVAAPPMDRVIPRTVAVVDALAASDDACIAVESLVCWPTGITLNLAVVTRQDFPADENIEIVGHPAEPRPLNKDGVAFGVQFSDGETVTNLDDIDFDRRRSEGLSLTPVSANGGQRFLRRGVYLRPLPPPGEMQIVMRWHNLGIDQTTVVVDADEVIEAAGQAIWLWP